MQPTMVRAAVVMTALTIAAIVGLAIVRPGDSIAIGHVLTIAIPTTTALLSLLSSRDNGKRQAEIHEKLNGRLDDQIALARQTGYAEGVRAERTRHGGVTDDP